MANPSQRGSAPDDDSWGKIASDLFGIQFNDDDDFELPDDDAPVKPKPESTVASGSAANVPSAELAETGFEEDVELEESVEPAKSAVTGDEDHDEFWDILESWNWDESSNQAAKTPRADDRSRRPRP